MTETRKPKAQDRRVRKTKAQLRHCLAELMKTKKVNEITVKELTEMADLNRGTFYLHYRDVFDLLEQTIEELHGEFDQALSKFAYVLPKEHPAPMLQEIFSLILENREIIGILLGENGDLGFVGRMRGLVKEYCMNGLVKNYRTKDPEFFDFFLCYLLDGCLGVVHHWLDGGCRETPAELAQITERIIINGVKSLD